MWITGITSNEIIGYDRDGERQDAVDQFDLRIYGLAYWSDDPDGYQLYVLSSEDNDSIFVDKIDIDNDRIMRVAVLDHPDGGAPRGCSITGQYDIYSWVFMSISNNGGEDRLDIWQVDGNSSWMEIEPVEGIIQPEDSEVFTLTFDATGLPDTTFEGQFVWTHDGVGGETILQVTLSVEGDPPPPPNDPPSTFSLLLPANGDTVITDEVTFSWTESIDPNPEDTVSYTFWMQVDMDSIALAADDTTLMVHLDSLGLDLPPDVAVMWWVVAVSGEHVVECEARFGFRLPPDAVGTDYALPSEFILQSAYPNPFNATTIVRFGLPHASSVVMRVHDLTGRQVAKLCEGDLQPGWHSTVWNASDLPSGTYILHLITPQATKLQKVVLMK